MLNESKHNTKPAELPVVTVVIPNFNYSKWIMDAINSVVAQDYPRIQIVVVDDHSTDGSYELVNSKIEVIESVIVDGVGHVTLGKYGGLPITNVFLDQNGGPGRARNIGVRIAWENTHIFAFLDSDDLYMPKKISKSVSLILSNPNIIGAVYSDYDTLHTRTGIQIREFKEPFSRERLLQECIVNNDTVITKVVLDKAGLYDEEMRTCEDYDLWMRVSENCLIVHIPESLIIVRVTGEGSTFSVSQEEWGKNWRRVMEKLQARANVK